MPAVASKNRKRIDELTDYQLLALIKIQKEKLKEKSHDATASMMVKNSISRLKKELARRKNIQS